jgi:phosphoserine phosphatase
MSDFALVLLAAPTGPPLAPGLVTAVLDRLPQTARAEPRWLAPGNACDVPLRLDTRAELDRVTDIVRNEVQGKVIGRSPVDVALVPASHRRKRLLVADMESTIIEQECLDELATFVGQRDRVADITARAMRGELNFEAALKERVGLLKGLRVTALEDLYRRITLVPGAETLIATMRKHGATCALVSGGFTFFTERIAHRLGFHTHQANTLDIHEDRLDGSVAEPILGREAKLATLQRLRDELGLQDDETMAVGDGANDLGMIKAAGLGVAYRAKPIVAAQAAVSIVHGDLTALLYLQGYRKDEFAAV